MKVSNSIDGTGVVVAPLLAAVVLLAVVARLFLDPKYRYSSWFVLDLYNRQLGREKKLERRCE